MTQKIYKLGDKEFEALLGSPVGTRYEHFVKRVADSEVMWGLSGPDGWMSYQRQEGQVAFPVWPHPRYAEACAIDLWEGATPEGIGLDEWFEEFTPELEEKDRLVAVFPDPQHVSSAVEPGRLKDDLLRELENYE
jgi:hypothetical protein